MVAFNTREFEDPEVVFDKVSPYLDITKEYFDILVKRRDSYEEIAHKVDDETAKNIKELGL